MTPEKIKKWKENRKIALDLYHNTDMNITQIARTLRVSTATADIMITGKNMPKFIKEDKYYKKEYKKVNDPWYRVNMREASPEDVIEVKTANMVREIVKSILEHTNSLQKIPLNTLEDFYKELQVVLPKEKIMCGKNDERMKEAKKIIEKFKECAYKEAECTLSLHDPDEERWFNDMEVTLIKLLYSYYY
jgi:hypothetical protein